MIHRLKVENIIEEYIAGTENMDKEAIEKMLAVSKRKPIFKKRLNWDFWNDLIDKREDWDIALDEVHNLVHSRMSMTKNNVLLSVWISQIRKILGNSKKNHIYLVTQKLDRLDVAFRDLTHTIVYCEKIEHKTTIATITRDGGRKQIRQLPKTFIIQYYFIGEQAVARYRQFTMTRDKSLYDKRTFFIGNPYFQFYDSFSLVRFGERVYL